MKQFSSFVKKPVIFHIGDFSRPTKYNESVLNTLKVQALAEHSSYKIFTPKEPHIVFGLSESEYEVTNKGISEISESFGLLRNKAFKASVDDSVDVLREAVSSGNSDLLQSHLVNGLREFDVKLFENTIRDELGLEHIKFEPTIKVDNLREAYVTGKIFNVGSNVEDDSTVYEILARGSNYITVISESGEISKKWIQDIHETHKPLLYNIDDGSTQFIFKTLRTENFDVNSYKILSDHFKFLNESPYAIKNLQFISRIDSALFDITILENAEILGKALSERSLTDAFASYLEARLDEEFLTEKSEPHVIFDRKLNDIHKEAGTFKTKYMAYKHFIGNMKFNPNYTVVAAKHVGRFKRLNRKFKESIDEGYMIAQSIMSLDDYKKLLKTSMKLDKDVKKNNPIKQKLATEEVNMVEADINKLVESVKTLNDLLCIYEDSQLQIATDEGVQDLVESTAPLTRTESIGLQLKVTAGKLTLKEVSDVSSINSKARTLAKALVIREMEDVSDDGIDRLLENKKEIVDRIAMKLVPRIKSIEAENL